MLRRAPTISDYGKNRLFLRMRDDRLGPQKTEASAVKNLLTLRIPRIIQASRQ